MRYDTEIFYVKCGEMKYDPKTGDYEEQAPAEIKSYASVMPLQIDKQRVVYGDLMRGSLEIHVKERFPGSFDKIRIGDKLYQVDARTVYRTKEGYIIHEDEG